MSTISKAYAELTSGIKRLGMYKSSKQETPPVSSPSKTGASLLPSPCSGAGKVYGTITGILKKPTTKQRTRDIPITSKPNTVEELFMDGNFLKYFFMFFQACERCVLTQVCKRWRDVLYNSCFWVGLTPVLNCKTWEGNGEGRIMFYQSLEKRGFDSISLFGAGDGDIDDMLVNFPHCRKLIRSLSLRCSSVSDNTLETALEKMECVYRLELSGCNEITEGGLWSFLNPKIVCLSITDCINIADDTVGAISQMLPSLHELTLQAYHVTDTALSFFSTKQSYTLGALRLHSCWEITNHGIVNLVHCLPNITTLSLSGCSKISDDGVELLAENLRKLRSLDLSWCPKVSDVGLESIACDLGQLEELTLDRCNRVTDIGVGYLSTMTSLNKLFLRWCTQVRDFGLQHLLVMKQLRVLSLAGCNLLTESGLSGIIQLRYLDELELTNCPGASFELIDYLKENMPRCLILK